MVQFSYTFRTFSDCTNIIKITILVMKSLQEFSFNGYNLDTIKQIGEGSYGKIYQIKSQKHGTDVAIKQIDMKKIAQENELDSLIQEVQLMKELKSPNIVELYESSIGDKYTYMILELCTSDLRKQLQIRKGKFMEEKSIQVFSQIVKGLKVLVDNSYVHRDVKPENILVKDSKYKITDFGYTKKIDFNSKQKLQDICGTPIYMAPQLLNNQPYTSKCDVWSLGLILYEMIYGSTPWPVRCIQSYRSALKKKPLAFPFDIRIGKQTKDFLKKALVVDQDKRIGWFELFQHPLIKHKIAGEIIQPEQMPFKIRKLLSRMQREAKRKLVDVIQIFGNYQGLQVLNFEQFQNLLKQLNPTITSYEIKLIFDGCDKNNNGSIEKDQFREMFCHVNYHRNPQLEKQIDEIIGIICAKEIQVKDLFEKFDTNKSGSITLDQFIVMIKSIAPAYESQFIKFVFDRLDLNKDGMITKKQFVNSIGGGLINQKNYVGLWVEKAVSNIKILKNHLIQMKMDAKKIVKLVDVNKDEHLDIKQFTRLMEIIEFTISTQEILDIFRILDNDQSGRISIVQLQDYID